MATTLKITDGTTEVNFLTDAAYRVSKWAPAVAVRRAGELGGRGPYEDVVEEMEISISGASALAKLETLQQLFDQATRWSRGEDVDAVLLRYEPVAASSELKVVILGPPAPGEAMIELPPNYTLSPVVSMIDPVVLRFRRTGLWLGEETTAQSSSTGVQFRNSITLTGTAGSVESPFALVLQTMPDYEKVIYDSFILVSSATTAAEALERVYVFEAESMTGVSGYSSVSDTTNKARGNNVLRYTPSVTTAVMGTGITITSDVDQSARRWGVFVSYRNNSASTAFTVDFELSTSGEYAFTPKAYIPGGVTTPRWLYLGSVSLTNGLNAIDIRVQASAASGTIDFDAVALLAMDSPVTDRAVAVLSKAPYGDTFASDYQLWVDHQMITRPAPAIYYTDGTEVLRQVYQGDPALFLRPGAAGVGFVWLGTGGSNVDHWRTTDGGAATISTTVQARRLRGYLTPA